MTFLDDFKLQNRPNTPKMMLLMLTTTEAAALAAVAPSTIKRWADQGVLPSVRTAGGHRRFDRNALERYLRAQANPTSGKDPLSLAWVQCLLDGRRHEIDGRLLEARSRLGCFANVCDELALALQEMGQQWQQGQISIAEEHVASDALGRALGRMGDALPVRLDGPTCLLACASDDEHTLALSMAELCLRELGWTPLWLGRRTPVEEINRLVRCNHVAIVALSASPSLDDAKTLKQLADQLSAVCQAHDVGLVLGGEGAWPHTLTHGVRVQSFSAFRDYVGHLKHPS